MAQLPITISGNLTHEPELVSFPSGARLCKLRVGSSRRVRAKNDSLEEGFEWTDVDHLFIDVEMWGQLAVNSNVSLVKGHPVVVTGYLVTHTWQVPADSNDSASQNEQKTESHSRIVLRATHVAFDMNRYQLGSRKVSQPTHNEAGVEMPEETDAPVPEGAAAETKEGVPF
ncbi:single-stranded DNA-binding protein [Corynebacterium breve]|uniref:Single-stranded DNA-binding protein n=1 Tax=Corynebacterium breve TaxID=3049799 RepID=A0ABY8VCJ3_9CORY|nr:single-stranded DNA-binding protein [Corynebacterium breve]WIM67213.1 single-stranded DNA-binding protein [Corynebacterium breve]